MPGLDRSADARLFQMLMHGSASRSAFPFHQIGRDPPLRILRIHIGSRIDQGIDVFTLVAFHRPMKWRSALIALSFSFNTRFQRHVNGCDQIVNVLSSAVSRRPMQRPGSAVVSCIDIDICIWKALRGGEWGIPIPKFAGVQMKFHSVNMDRGGCGARGTVS